MSDYMKNAAVIIFRGKASACVPAGIALCPFFYPDAESQMDDAIIMSTLGGGMDGRGRGPSTLAEIVEYTKMRSEAVEAAIKRLGDKIAHDAQSGIYILSTKFQVEQEVARREINARRTQYEKPGLGN